MSVTIPFLVGVAILILGYSVFSKKLEKSLFPDLDKRQTPAHTNKGVDWSPANPLVLFGHHFSSIAGAGPIVGPVLAAALFGYSPVWLWIVAGSVLLGGVHDWLSLMVSVRNSGKSISDVASSTISSNAKKFFGWFVFFALILVVAAFTMLAAKTLVQSPELVIPTFGFIIAAIMFGFMRRKMGLLISTVIALAIAAIFIWLGFKFPIKLPLKFNAILVWELLLLIYAVIASLLPVELLLQPRDYLSSYLLFAGLILGTLGILFSHNIKISLPSFTHSPKMPIFPFLFIVVACGAISGFHSLVSSGTTSKQLSKESHARPVAYGGMLTEGLLALIALSAVSVVGSKLTNNPLFNFSNGFSILTQALGIPAKLSFVAATFMINAFILTTLDTSVRIGRMIFTELTGASPTISTLILTVAALTFLQLGALKAIWPVFGACNQLIAALTLIVLYAYLKKHGSKFATYLGVAALFMLLVTITGLVMKISTAQKLLTAFIVILLAMVRAMIYELVKKVLTI